MEKHCRISPTSRGAVKYMSRNIWIVTMEGQLIMKPPSWRLKPLCMMDQHRFTRHRKKCQNMLMKRHQKSYTGMILRFTRSPQHLSIVVKFRGLYGPASFLNTNRKTFHNMDQDWCKPGRLFCTPNLQMSMIFFSIITTWEGP